MTGAIFELLLPIFLGLARHGLTTAGGYLIANGVLNSSQSDQFIGLGVVFVGAVWSWSEKLATIGLKATLAQIVTQLPASQGMLSAPAAPSSSLAAPVAAVVLGLAALVSCLPEPVSAAEVPASATMWKQIEGASAADLTWAKAKADEAGATVRSACYAAWLDVLVSKTVSKLQPAPAPAKFATYETLAQAADVIAPGSPFMVACTPVAKGMNRTMASWVGLVTGGTVGIQHFGN